jgi:hypothetical protein
MTKIAGSADPDPLVRGMDPRIRGSAPKCHGSATQFQYLNALQAMNQSRLPINEGGSVALLPVIIVPPGVHLRSDS